ncbi:MAG TPA: helix-turn-helix domain-containing protein [Kofleriaceae bacterium]|jgi:transcriptional regulator with XRE-family HTH domain
MEPRSKAPGDPRDTARPTAPRARSQAPATSAAASSRPQPKHGWSRERFCEYLRAQRERASLSIEDIARVTKIPERSLRQLEEGKFEELPADVFVRGFLRSYARVVGVNADDVVRRYAMCGLDPAPVASELAQVAAEQIAALAEKDPSAGEVAVAKVEPAPAPAQPVEPAASAAEVIIDSGVDEVRTASAPVRSHANQGTRKKRRKSGHHAKLARRAAAAPAEPTAAAVIAVEAEPTAAPAPASARQKTPRRERAFLPPAWSEEESGRRGPLTLAVIILVIIATLTMTYLLRRPSYSGDGVTRQGDRASSRAS